jgi:hypothetical protein
MRVKQWLVLVYRIPTDPASKRVAIWRDLKRTGALSGETPRLCHGAPARPPNSLVPFIRSSPAAARSATS